MKRLFFTAATVLALTAFTGCVTDNDSDGTSAGAVPAESNGTSENNAAGGLGTGTTSENNGVDTSGRTGGSDTLAN